MKQIYLYYLTMVIMLLIMVIKIFLAVAFLTLLERKILGGIQERKGPNKLGLSGLIQPFSDAVKLISKENFLTKKMNMMYYFYTPVFMLLLSLMMWLIYPFFTNLMMMKFGLIYLMCCLGMGSYGLLISGWSSNSMYSMLGAVRSLAQSISYEVSLVIIMLSSFMLIESFNLIDFSLMQSLWMIYYMWPISVMFFFSILAELNRTPFDFSEGESELVSGFNVEYGSGGFVLIFLSEYSSILLMSYLFSMMYLGYDFNNLMFYVKVLMMSFMILWIRGSFPRFRYDLLMYFSWLVILPFSLNYLMFMLIFKILI